MKLEFVELLEKEIGPLWMEKGCGDGVSAAIIALISNSTHVQPTEEKKAKGKMGAGE